MDPEAGIHGSEPPKPASAGRGRPAGGRGPEVQKERKSAKSHVNGVIIMCPPRCLHSPRPGHAFRGPERSFTRKVRFTHFSHFLALLVDFNQGKHKPKWTFSFRSEKERKRAYFLKMLKSALLDPANLKKRGTSVKNDALAVLMTFLKKFLKIFCEKSPFAFLYFSLGKS